MISQKNQKDMFQPSPGDTIAVWFSCGAASAVALEQTVRLYGDICTVRALNNPVIEEGEDNPRFLRDVAKWLDIDIEPVLSSKYPSASAVDVWEDRQFMSGPEGAPCTAILKKRARQEWEKENHVDWHVLGFTADEQGRLDRFRMTERDNVIGVLVDQGITKQDCYARILGAGLSLPVAYSLGYPNANCRGCVKATSPTYWNHVRKVDPEVFDQRARQSRKIGARLARVKGERVFLDELDPDAVGRPMKDTLPDCGIFCEERDGGDTL